MSLYRPDILLAVASQIEDEVTTSSLKLKHDNRTGNNIGIHTVRRFVNKGVKSGLLNLLDHQVERSAKCGPQLRAFQVSDFGVSRFKSDQKKICKFYNFIDEDNLRTSWLIQADKLYDPNFLLELGRRGTAEFTRGELKKAYDDAWGTDLKRQEVARELMKLEREPAQVRRLGYRHKFKIFSKPSFTYALTEEGLVARKEHRHVMQKLYGTD